MRTRDMGSGIMKRNIHKLAGATEEMVKGYKPPDSLKHSSKSSSTSLNDSESGYTEHLVESKFKEASFKKVSKTIFREPGEDENDRNPIIYRAKLYDENFSQKDLPTPTLIYKDKKTVRQREAHQTNLDTCFRHKCFGTAGCMIPKSSSISCKICKCGKPSLSRKVKEVEDGCGRSEMFLEGGCEKMVREAGEARQELETISPSPVKPVFNTSLLKLTHHKEQTDRNSLTNSYQVQQMPTVNIPPNFTKQIGPIIDIKVPKPFVKNTNIALVEYIHPQVLQENKLKINTGVIDQHIQNFYRSRSATSKASNRKENKEIKLHKCLKEMLKKLHEKRPFEDLLGNEINYLILLLKKIVPFHSAPIRFQNGSISLIDESIDLFFTNMDIVQEVVENELKNPVETFCKNPEYLVKAIKLLSENIRSIFDINVYRHSSVNPSINNYIEKKRCLKNLRLEEKENMKSLHLEETTGIVEPPSPFPSSASGSITYKDNIIPKDVYIPFKKLTPGGMYRQMEEAKSLSEIELRRIRLEKIHEINQQLKTGLQTDDVSKMCKENKESKQNDNTQEILNRTFVIDSGNEDNENEKTEIISTVLSEVEGMRKSDREYEEDWEEELPTSDSSSGPGRLQMKSVMVEAQVHETGLESGCRSSESRTTLHPSGSNVGRERDPSERRGSPPEPPARDAPQTVSIAIQTQRLTPLGRADSGTQTRPRVYPTEVENHSSSNSTSCPLLRITNPITNALLEVRFPEQTEMFQSSMCFQKSESKEEINIFYNSNQDKDFKRKTGSKDFLEQEITTMNQDNELNKVMKKEQVKECNNDFENITMGFIGFLESKVTEMVNKFKHSETASEKLLTEKLSVKQGTKLSRNSSHNVGLERLNSSIPMYKSASSLFSDKSADELKFGKNVVSRGSSPEIGRIQFENLVSPPLVLQLNKDVPSQTEEFVRSLQLTHASVEPRETILETSNLSNRNKVQEQGTFPATGSNPHTKVNQIIQLPTDEGLRWSSPVVSKNILSLSQNRLLPLPEDVLSSTDNINEKLSSNFKDINLNTVEVENPQGTCVENSEYSQGTKRTSLENTCEQLPELEKEFKTSEAADISKETHNIDEEIAFPLSRIEDGGDSQRTSQIFNVISMSDSNVVNVHFPSNTQDLLMKECGLIMKRGGNESGNIIKRHQVNSTSPFGDSYLESKGLSELAHVMIVRGNADPGIETNSKCKDVQSTITLNNRTSPFGNSYHSESCDCPVIKEMSSEIDECNSNDSTPPHTHTNISQSPLKQSIKTKCIEKSIKKEQRNKKIEENNRFTFSNVENNLGLVGEDNSGWVGLPSADPVSSEARAPGESVREAEEEEEEEEEEEDSQLSGDRSSSSLHSLDHITIYYQDSEMSEGEIGYVYTSQSYSSGEIKPTKRETLDWRTEINFSPSLRIEACSSTVVNNTHQNIQLDSSTNEVGYMNDSIPPEIVEGSSSGSISTGELKNLLDFDESRLDQATFRYLTENSSQYNAKSSTDSLPGGPSETKTHNTTN